MVFSEHVIDANDVKWVEETGEIAWRGQLYRWWERNFVTWYTPPDYILCLSPISGITIVFSLAYSSDHEHRYAAQLPCGTNISIRIIK